MLDTDQDFLIDEQDISRIIQATSNTLEGKPIDSNVSMQIAIQLLERLELKDVKIDPKTFYKMIMEGQLSQTR